jgi:hypothetical protein
LPRSCHCRLHGLLPTDALPVELVLDVSNIEAPQMKLKLFGLAGARGHGACIYAVRYHAECSGAANSGCRRRTTAGATACTCLGRANMRKQVESICSTAYVMHGKRRLKRTYVDTYAAACDLCHTLGAEAQHQQLSLCVGKRHLCIFRRVVSCKFALQRIRKCL